MTSCGSDPCPHPEHRPSGDTAAPSEEDMRAYRRGLAEVRREASGGALVYLGFGVNGEECERHLGGAFETHLPSRDQIVYRSGGREVVASVGDMLPSGGAACEVVPVATAVEWSCGPDPCPHPEHLASGDTAGVAADLQGPPEPGVLGRARAHYGDRMTPRMERAAAALDAASEAGTAAETGEDRFAGYCNRGGEALPCRCYSPEARAGTAAETGRAASAVAYALHYSGGNCWSDDSCPGPDSCCYAEEQRETSERADALLRILSERGYAVVSVRS